MSTDLSRNKIRYVDIYCIKEKTSWLNPPWVLERPVLVAEWCSQLVALVPASVPELVNSKLTVCYWTWWFLFDLPIENCHFAYIYVSLPEGSQ